MKKIIATLFLFSFFIIQSQAQYYTDNGTSGSYLNTYVSFNWYLSGSTIYYEIDVISPEEFIESSDPEGRDNSAWFVCNDMTNSNYVYYFEVIYNEATLPYEGAHYEGSFSIEGYSTELLDFSAGASFMTATAIDYQATPFGITLPPAH